MPIIANGSEDFLKYLIFWDICLNGNCLKLSVIFRIGCIMKNWPDKNKICRNKIDFGINLKIKKAENIVRVKIKILALKTNPASFISLIKFGISGSFINPNHSLDMDKVIDKPNKIRVVKNQTIDIFFLLWISICALLPIKIAAAGVAGSQ